jgi:hypothetical protein
MIQRQREYPIKLVRWTGLSSAASLVSAHSYAMQKCKHGLGDRDLSSTAKPPDRLMIFNLQEDQLE